MNNDLISRSGLGVDYCNPDVFENKAYAEGWNSLIKIIKEAPDVDAEPVRHGRWEWRGGIPWCSNCEKMLNGYSYENYVSTTPICSFCGAKMDGDADA